MTTPSHFHPTRDHQQGVVLVTVLLFLLILTVLAVSMTRGANLQERLAGNLRDRQLAYQAAEAALRDAERVISTDADGPFAPLDVAAFTAACVGGRCRSNQAAPRWSQLTDADWQSNQTMIYGDQTATADLPGLSGQPRVLIEFQGTTQPIEPGKPCVALFLITARSVGQSDSARVVLQSVYRHRSGVCLDAI